MNVLQTGDGMHTCHLHAYTVNMFTGGYVQGTPVVVAESQVGGANLDLGLTGRNRKFDDSQAIAFR